jgi:hypothetical protein
VRSILAIELCARFDPALHAALRAIVTVERERMSYGERWARFGDAGWALTSASALWVSGCWDFWDDDAKAQSDFRMWVEGMMTREGARAEPSGADDPHRPFPGYLTLTMACLIQRGAQCERQLAAICDVPEERLWARDTFLQILDGLRMLSFSVVEKETMYLIPRDPGFALTDSDMANQKFHYLRPIR